jgi:DNA-binding XRE family transcriptional regulator
MISPLKLAILNANLTQKKVSEAIGVNERTLNSWVTLRARPSSNHCFALSHLLNISVEQIFPGRF